jgi:hypothetical protein
MEEWDIFGLHTLVLLCFYSIMRFKLALSNIGSQGSLDKLFGQRVDQLPARFEAPRNM